MKAKKVTKKVAIKKETPKDNYEKRYSLVGRNILELSRETKRKPAFIKIAVPDELVEGLIKNQFQDILEEPIVRAIGLEWMQLKKGSPQDEN